MDLHIEKLANDLKIANMQNEKNNFVVVSGHYIYIFLTYFCLSILLRFLNLNSKTQRELWNQWKTWKYRRFSSSER